MKLVNFIDNRFQEIRLAEQEAEKNREFNIVREAEQHALHALRHGISTILKWLLIPVLFGRYFLVQLQLVRAPEPVLIRLMEKAKIKDDAEKQKKLSKLGMKDLNGKKPLEVVNPNQPA